MAIAAASAPLDPAVPGGSDRPYPSENKGLVSFSVKEIASGLQTTNGKNENLLIVSPYEEEPHLLDLRTLGSANQLLAQALTGLKCLRDDYATAPYVEIFNWAEVIESIRQQVTTSNFNWKENSFYIVVFRSQIPPTTVYADLGILDKAAHAEATKSGGFLKYWFGSPDDSGRNLATCVWRSLHDARVGSVGEAHRQAAGAARQLYSEWKIERLRLLIKDDAKEWEINQWVD
ncbi:UPF0643 protein PB2B2.08 [Lachnellula arida]|uniref:UPF0643 protein PB2B2.08 n=1 Tax=Lachnellula arida TaxID=1316785 RepID=A0A8T9BIX4_9HELO|nr:UPF0643 protein PB2B2.08 [Lachnellula arida]